MYIYTHNILCAVSEPSTGVDWPGSLRYCCDCEHVGPALGAHLPVCAAPCLLFLLIFHELLSVAPNAPHTHNLPRL